MLLMKIINLQLMLLRFIFQKIFHYTTNEDKNAEIRGIMKYVE